MSGVFQLLIIAGVHGQEPQSTFLLEKISKDFILVEKEPYQIFSSTENNLVIYSIPRFNEYGLLNSTRGNKNKIDLNRNLPAVNWSKEFSHIDYNPGPNPASEIETKKLVSLIKEFEPDLIISIHTNHFVTVKHPPQVNFDGNLDSQGYKYAQRLSELIDLELTSDIGYSTPGSLGSYAKDLKIPCITLELDDELDNDESLLRYEAPLKEFLYQLSILN